jgi:RNA polymerase sigma-70 factor (ECF subfamily)
VTTGHLLSAAARLPVEVLGKPETAPFIPVAKQIRARNKLVHPSVHIVMGEERRQFEEIFLPFLDAAYNLARWIVQHDQDAQDIVQEAYLRAFKGFSGFRGGNGRAWLLTIVRNTAYSWMNKHASDERLVPYEEEKHAKIISFDQPTREIVNEKRKEHLQNALLRLSTEYREVIVLYEFEGLSYKELALALGVPLGTVMSRLNRARRRLQQELAHIRGAEAVNEM